MTTIIVTANDTGSGKTWVAATIAKLCVQAGGVAQVVKPVETGVSPGGAGDAEFAENALRQQVALHDKASFHTLRRFTQPLAPVEAARRDAARLDFDQLAAEVLALPAADWRIVEGAGGLAVPLEEGASPRDWSDFARAVGADWVVLVVDDRLGAINQARLLACYARQAGLAAGWWLNQSGAVVDPAVHEVNRKALAEFAPPLWAAQSHDSWEPELIDIEWLPQ